MERKQASNPLVRPPVRGVPNRRFPLGLTAVVCGPIYGVPDFVRRFQQARGELELAGYNVITPLESAPQEVELEHRVGGVAPGTEMHQRALSLCIQKMLLHADVVVFLPGWRESRGCMVERVVCWATGLPIVEYDEWLSTGA